MFIAGLFGIFLHVLVKVNSINKKLATENYRSVFAQYWKTDWTVFILSLVAVGAAVFISSEWLNIKDTDKTPSSIAEIFQYKVVQFIKTTFVVIGYCADSAVGAYLGGAEQKLIKKAQAEGVPMEDIITVKDTTKKD